MKNFTFALLVAVAACRKPDAVGGAGTAGSGSAAPSVGSGSATPSAGSGSAAGSDSDAPFDDTVTVPKQPKRSAHQQAVVDGAVRALRTALTIAKTGKDTVTVCKAFSPLNKAMTRLLDVSAPPGVDAMMFSSQRSAVLQIFDGSEAWCQHPEDVGVDTLQSLMSDLRSQFLILIALGA